jgi:hypothetical protein
MDSVQGYVQLPEMFDATSVGVSAHCAKLKREREHAVQNERFLARMLREITPLYSARAHPAGQIST